ncbi:MAG: hypothetical protein MZV64_23235 [Ignavibacteriales bacterium]|nr:hypothetical protein [Ignavibacteriales bacterium]
MAFNRVGRPNHGRRIPDGGRMGRVRLWRDPSVAGQPGGCLCGGLLSRWVEHADRLHPGSRSGTPATGLSGSTCHPTRGRLQPSLLVRAGNTC